MSWLNVPYQPALALVMSERSGGVAPPLALRAACSLAKGDGKRSAGTPGRSNISPSSPGPSLTVKVAANALTCSSENSGPPLSERLRKDRSRIEWQAEQTSL